jgi:hypothetical protein
MRPTGYIHYEPTLIERASAAMRALSVPKAWAPTEHPPFNDLFGASWCQYVGACTGFGLVKGAMVMAKMQGINVPELSAFSIYTPARIRRDGREHLKDNGARVSDAAWAWNNIGACEEQFWPSHSLGSSLQKIRVNEEPAGVQQSGCVVNAAKWRRLLPIKLKRILATGPALVQQMCYALHNKQYVIVALPVGHEFDAGSTVIPPQEALRGTHLLGLLDWRQVDGEYQCLLGNSWGWNWGNDGRQWASSGLLQQARAAFYFERVGQ